MAKYEYYHEILDRKLNNVEINTTITNGWQLLKIMEVKGKYSYVFRREIFKKEPQHKDEELADVTW